MFVKILTEHSFILMKSTKEDLNTGFGLHFIYIA